MAAIPNDKRGAPWMLVQLIKLIGMQDGKVTVRLHEGRFGNGAINHRLKDSICKEIQSIDQGGKDRKQQTSNAQPSTIRIGGVEQFIKKHMIGWLVEEGGKFAELKVRVHNSDIKVYSIRKRRRLI